MSSNIADSSADREQSQQNCTHPLFHTGHWALQMFKLLLEMDAQQQLPVVVFNLSRQGCNFRVCSMAQRLKAAMAGARGQTYEDVRLMREQLETEIRDLQKDINDLLVGLQSWYLVAVHMMVADRSLQHSCCNSPAKMSS